MLAVVDSLNTTGEYYHYGLCYSINFMILLADYCQ
jgi:hypothetical protein